VQALHLYGESLAPFETIGDRAEEARVLAEMAWTHLRCDDPAAARPLFLDSVQAYTELASTRRVGLSLFGLAAVAAVEHRPEAAVAMAEAAEVYASEEGIVNVYADNPFGRELLEHARASLPPDAVAHVAETGRGLTVAEVIGLAPSGARLGG
jgi:hypothetical protein